MSRMRGRLVARDQRRLARRTRLATWLITLALSSIAGPGFTQPTTCQSVVHVDFHERPALNAVRLLIRAPQILKRVPYRPVSLARRQPHQSESARMAAEVIAKMPDVVIIHGSTFVGSDDPRFELGQLIKTVAAAKPDIRGFVIYSSADDLNADALAIGEPDSLRSKLYFMDAPIENRFHESDGSATALKNHLKRLCEL